MQNQSQNTNTNNDNKNESENIQNINLIQTTLAQSIENAAKLLIKDRRRSSFISFIIKFILTVATIIFIFSMLIFTDKSPIANSSSISEKHVAVIKIKGEISAEAPASAELINHSLKSAFENDNSVAVILQINSPGGSPVQAGIIYDEIKRLKKLYPKKSIYATVEDMCASGGYYIAAATDYIYADKASIVGSIGVIMEGFGLDKAIDKFGVQRRIYTSGENKAMLDPFSAENKKHVDYTKEMIAKVHQQFITAVKNGRGNRLKEDNNTFSGLIWTGEEAVKNGIIDGLYSTNNVARLIIKNEKLVDYTIEEGLANRLAKQFGSSLGTTFIKASNMVLK